MNKAILLAAGLALVSAATTASAQTIYRSAQASGYIGLRFDDVTQATSGKTTSRVVIRDVSDDSPASKAGLRAGDEIVRINGLAATNGKFAAIARTLAEGDTVKLRVKRDDKER